MLLGFFDGSFESFYSSIWSWHNHSSAAVFWGGGGTRQIGLTRTSKSQVSLVKGLLLLFIDGQTGITTQSEVSVDLRSLIQCIT